MSFGAHRPVVYLSIFAEAASNLSRIMPSATTTSLRYESRCRFSILQFLATAALLRFR